MASRIHGDVYVRFRGRYAETCRRKAVRRCIPSLHPFGGVSLSYANSDSSYTYAHIGSRLAFRGKLVRAESVEAYKAIREVL